MNGILLGVIFFAALAFFAFLVTVIVVAARNRRPGQTFAEASRMTVEKGLRSVKSKFVRATPGTLVPATMTNGPHPAQAPTMGPSDVYSTMEAAAQSAGADASAQGTTGGGEGVSDTTKGGTQGVDFTSFSRPAGPVSIMDQAPAASLDVNAPGAQAYDAFAAEHIQAGLDAMAGRHAFGGSQLPAAPLTDSMMRYTGDFDAARMRKEGRRDPLLDTPMVKTDLGYSNRGFSVFQ